MKRDMELIRKLALALEESANGVVSPESKFEGYTAEQVGYHAYLMMQAGLAEGLDMTLYNSSVHQATLTTLTWQGHEFIETARDESRWKRAMGIVQEKGGAVTLSIR